MALYSAQEFGREDKQSLTEEEAGRLQLHGHSIVDENGDPVVLYPLANEDDEGRVELKKKAGEKSKPKAKTKAKKKAVKPKSKSKPKAKVEKTEDKNAPSEDASEQVPKEERGPANASDIGYKPTGL